MALVEKPSSRWQSEESAREFLAMIAWDKRLAREGPFFKELFESHGVRSVLDLACGPGRHAAMFASWGLDSWGADGSPAMIKLARNHAREQAVNARFVQAPYGKLKGKIPCKFDAIINIGNSLVQVSSRTELLTLMEEVRSLLNPGGIFLSQSRNYEGLTEDELDTLPVSRRIEDGRETLVLRMHQPQGERVRFYAVKLVREGEAWKAYPRMTWFYRVTRAGLARAIKFAGFRRARWYGGYDLLPFNPRKSPDLVVIARVS
jgi:glycine/sarcosine N-methyltransferase